MPQYRKQVVELCNITPIISHNIKLWVSKIKRVCLTKQNYKPIYLYVLGSICDVTIINKRINWNLYNALVDKIWPSHEYYPTFGFVRSKCHWTLVHICTLWYTQECLVVTRWVGIEINESFIHLYFYEGKFYFYHMITQRCAQLYTILENMKA